MFFFVYRHMLALPWAVINLQINLRIFHFEIFLGFGPIDKK